MNNIIGYTLTISLIWGCSQRKEPSSPPLQELKGWEMVGKLAAYGTYRFENKEVICYFQDAYNAAGMHCLFKKEETK